MSFKTTYITQPQFQLTHQLLSIIHKQTIANGTNNHA